MAPRPAVVYQRDLSRLAGQTAVLARRSWRRIDRADMSGSWLRLLRDVLALLIGAQAVAAEMADPYLGSILDDDVTAVNPDGYAGMTTGGEPVGSLLYLPVIDAKQRIAAGANPAGALRQSRDLLDMYVRTTVSDTGRLAVTSGMARRPHARGWYRMLVPPSCARCAILAGKFFRWSDGFERHPQCDCVHIPVQEADDSYLFDARKAIEAGQVTGVSKADRQAIDLGADPSQVVNAKSGMYKAFGGRSFTTTGTTRRGVAGARILQRDLDRVLGKDTTGIYRNYTFDRQKALEYSNLLRRGKTFTRRTASGRAQSYAYRYANTPRPTPETILADATSREDAVRLLTNYGYIT